MKLFTFPGLLSERVQRIGGQTEGYGRTPIFSDVVFEVEKSVLDLMGCGNGRLLLFSCVGTGCLDAVVAGWGQGMGKTLVVNGGEFGARLVNLCRYYDVGFIEHVVEFGRDIDYGKLAKELNSEKVDSLVIQHHETSSGQMFDLERVGDLCCGAGVNLIVDAISSFCSDPITMDRWGISAAAFSSQKGLCLPPGLAGLVVTKEFLECRDEKGKSFYFQVEANERSLARGQPLYSPQVNAALRLRERLREINEQGLESLLQRVKKKAEIFRQRIKECDLAMRADNPATALTGIVLPDDAMPLVHQLAESEIYVMPSCERNLMRVAHVGESTIEDHLDLADRIVAYLRT